MAGLGGGGVDGWVTSCRSSMVVSVGGDGMSRAPPTRGGASHHSNSGHVSIVCGGKTYYNKGGREYLVHSRINCEVQKIIRY